MKYVLRVDDKHIESVVLSKLLRSGAKVCVNTRNSSYLIEFREHGTFISGGLVGETPTPVYIHGTGSIFSNTLCAGRIDATGRLEFNQYRTSPIKQVTIEAPRKLIRSALFDYCKP